MATPTKWVRDYTHTTDYKKQYFRNGEWHDVKTNFITWNRMPYIAMSCGYRRTNRRHNYDYPYNIQPIWATLKVTARRLWEYIRDHHPGTQEEAWDVYKGYILSLVKDDEDIRAAWKEMTMKIIALAISYFPFPVPEGQDLATEIMMFIADKFYDFMFSL